MAEQVADVVEVIDEAKPGNNMYGCAPCPKCGARFRWPDQQGILRCDDCGYLCRWQRKEDVP
jgi:DNA-directed RNA polymerase subunit RPC12/RpoP